MRLKRSISNRRFLLAGNIGVVGANMFENKSGKSEKAEYERQSLWNRLFAQEKMLSIECPMDYQLCPSSVGGGCCPKTRICGTDACLAVVQTTVTVSHPKITEAPLFKRKVGSNKWAMIHEGIQGQKRDATACGTNYQLCPASLNGGCCPNDRSCGTDSCYAVSATPATVCGMSGYFACGISEGGGCCPQSYACQVGSCSPSAGVTNSETCLANSYLCPASVGYGCCRNGMACGLSSCYMTSVSSFVFTEILTTTDAQNLAYTVTSIISTVSTPSMPTDVIINTNPLGMMPKVTPSATAIPKTSPTSTATSSNGLSKPQIGGIIAGAVALLAILIIATFCIIRRLNKVVKATTASQSRTRSSSYGQRSQPPHYQKPEREVDELSIDPLMMTPSEVSRSFRYPSHPSATHTPAHEVDGSAPSPPLFSSPFSPRSPPFNHQHRGYNPVPMSDSNSSSGYGRNPSLDSTPSHSHNHNAGYFDIPTAPDLRDQNLRFGHFPPSRRPSQHQRNWSDVSNQSEISQASSSLAELDAGSDGDRRSSLQRALQSFGMGSLSNRRKSSQTNPSPITLTGGPTSRHPEWGPGPIPGAAGLGYILEAGESRLKVNQATDTEMTEIPLVEQQEYTQKYSGDLLTDRRLRP